MPYNEKSKARTMKYLEKLKEIRFRVKPEEYARYEQAAKQGNYQSLRQFYMSAINEKVDDILNQPISQDEKILPPDQNEPEEELIENVIREPFEDSP